MKNVTHQKKHLSTGVSKSTNISDLSFRYAPRALHALLYAFQHVYWYITLLGLLSAQAILEGGSAKKLLFAA